MSPSFRGGAPSRRSTQTVTRTTAHHWHHWQVDTDSAGSSQAVVATGGKSSHTQSPKHNWTKKRSLVPFVSFPITSYRYRISINTRANRRRPATSSGLHTARGGVSWVAHHTTNRTETGVCKRVPSVRPPRGRGEGEPLGPLSFLVHFAPRTYGGKYSMENEVHSAYRPRVHRPYCGSHLGG